MGKTLVTEETMAGYLSVVDDAVAAQTSMRGALIPVLQQVQEIDRLPASRGHGTDRREDGRLGGEGLRHRELLLAVQARARREVRHQGLSRHRVSRARRGRDHGRDL